MKAYKLYKYSTTEEWYFLSDSKCRAKLEELQASDLKMKLKDYYVTREIEVDDSK